MFKSKIASLVFKVSALFSVLLLTIRIVISTPLTNYDDPLTRERFGQYNCYKYKICTPGSPRVCGYNPSSLEMAEFDDPCTMYQVNCRQREFYRVVDMSQCLSKKQFLAEYNDSLQFEHVNRTYELQFHQDLNETTPSNDSLTLLRPMPGLVQLVDSKAFQ